MTTLDVQGAFDAAWWPAILRGLRDADCPRNLYQLTQDYVKDRRAVTFLNNKKLEKRVTKGCPQVSCGGPGYWIILYNYLLNIKFTHHTKIVAFADDLVIMTKAESIPDADNITNAELGKISTWQEKTSFSLTNRNHKSCS